MAEIEFLPESVDGAADEELLATGTGRIGRWLALGGFAGVAVLVAALLFGDKGSSPRPVTPSLPLQPTATAPVTAPPPYRGLTPLRFGASSRLPVLGLAVLGTSTWVLQDDGLHVVRPGRPPLQLALPGIAQTARLVADPPGRLVWLVTQRRAQAYALPDARMIWDGPVPAFSDVAAMGERLYLAGGTELVEVGPGLPGPQRVFLAPEPLTAVAADPARNRLFVAYQDGPSRVFSLRPSPSGAAHVERSTTIRTVNVTLAVANDAIWLAGFSTGGGALMRLDPQTLRPVLHYAYAGSLGSGAVLVAEGASSVWVREGLGGPDLRCVDSRSGAQAQTWELDGLIASTQ
ncbi:MAG: hypothetical protein ACTHMS_16200, partial [Jatrophihabitans sp.]|uniref:hypothetical protein n=1 Tax=Jatrophihabitans sp. TaxID=1932789 RepID=UPI003F7CE32D